MENSIVSNKYQIVIPKKLRQQLGIKPGQKLHIERLGSDSLKVTTKSALDKYVGSVQGVWGDDPAKTIRKQRDEWDD